MLCCVTFHPLCKLSDYTVVGTALGTTLTVGMSAIGLGVSQALFSPGHQRRSTDIRSQDCSNHGSGPVMGEMGAAQTLAWPNPHVYVPTKSTAAKARLGCRSTHPFRCSVGAEFPKLVVGFSVRSLRSCKERFQLFFLSCIVPGAQLWFQLHLCMWATHRGLLQRLPWSTRARPSEEGGAAVTVVMGALVGMGHMG